MTELSPEARELLQRGREALAADPQEVCAVREALRAELGAEAWDGDAGADAGAPLAAAAWKLAVFALLLVVGAVLYAVLSG